MGLPTSCGADCKMFFREQGDLCRRHAPGVSPERLEIAKWPQRDPDSRCREGSDDIEPVQCAHCVAWWQPNGKPLSPAYIAAGARRGIWAPMENKHDASWWSESGLCVLKTAIPSGDTVRYHPRVTNGRLDGCGDGENIEKKEEGCQEQTHD